MAELARRLNVHLSQIDPIRFTALGRGRLFLVST
jgi:hypothetical protein